MRIEMARGKVVATGKWGGRKARGEEREGLEGESG